MGHSTQHICTCEHRWSKVIDGHSYHFSVPPAVGNLHDRFQRHMFYVGLALGCHQRPDRSFSCRGRQIPLCARCLGILVGPLFAPLYFIFPDPWIAIVCASIFLIDASTQLVGMRESNNWLRLLSGAAFSASVLFLLFYGVTL